MNQVRRQDEWVVGDMAYISGETLYSTFQPGDIIRITGFDDDGAPSAFGSVLRPKNGVPPALRILTKEELLVLPVGSTVELIRDVPTGKRGDRIVVDSTSRLRATLTYALVSRPGVLTLKGRTANAVEWTTNSVWMHAPTIETDGHVFISRRDLIRMLHAINRLEGQGG